MHEEIKQLPTLIPTDATVPYDTSRFLSVSSMNDLDTMLAEAKGKILAGTMSASAWGDVMKTWRSIGGEQLMKDKTEQYLEYLKAAKK